MKVNQPLRLVPWVLTTSPSSTKSTLDNRNALHTCSSAQFPHCYVRHAWSAKKNNLYCSIVLPLGKNRLKVRLLKLVLSNRGWWESTLNNGETTPIDSHLRHHSACPTNIGFSDGPLVTSLSSLRLPVKLTIAVYQAAWVQVRELVAHL